MAGKPTDDIVRCSFCNKTQAQVRKLIAGPNGTYICDECIGICSEIIEEELDYNERELFDDINLLTPEEMKAFLDDYNKMMDSIYSLVTEKKNNDINYDNSSIYP